MNYRSIALFTDLDGTLFNSRREVSPENKMAIDRFIAEGGSFGISTGRAPENARRLLPGIHINSWSVVLNGAEAYHFSEGKTAFPCCLPQQQMELLIRWTFEMLPRSIFSFAQIVSCCSCPGRNLPMRISLQPTSQ